MAPEDRSGNKSRDEIQRKREREDELSQRIKPNTQEAQKAESKGASGEQIETWIKDSNILIEQVNNLYQMYVGGAEKNPPIVQRKRLEELIHKVQMATKSTTTLRFLSSNLNSKFLTFKDKWEKLLKDLESGKVKRRGEKKERL
jgi:hypothetical protein